MRRVTTLLALSLMAALALAGCGAATPTPVPPTPTSPGQAESPTPGAQSGLATVESIEIRTLESMPVQVQAVIRGVVPDACTKVGMVGQSRDGNTIKLVLNTERPADAVCAQVLTPFETTVDLDVKGLKAGSYTVTAHGVSATFTLDADVAP